MKTKKNDKNYNDLSPGPKEAIMFEYFKSVLNRNY